MRIIVLPHWLFVVAFYYRCCDVLVVAALKREVRGNLIAFNTIGHDVALGLDFEMPFVRVPIGKHFDKNGQPRAIMTINKGAIITSTLLAGGALFVGYLLKSLGIQGTGMHPYFDNHGPIMMPTKDGNAKETPNENTHKTAREQTGDGSRCCGESEEAFARTLGAFKMVYINTTGDRTEITLSQFYKQLEEGFEQYDIDLQACILQSICTIVSQSQSAVQIDRASAIQKIIGGIVQMPWVKVTLQCSIMGDVIQVATATVDNGNGMDHPQQCVHRFASCNLKAPHEKLMQLLYTHVQFA